MKGKLKKRNKALMLQTIIIGIHTARPVVLIINVNTECKHIFGIFLKVNKNFHRISAKIWLHNYLGGEEFFLRNILHFYIISEHSYYSPIQSLSSADGSLNK